MSRRPTLTSYDRLQRSYNFSKQGAVVVTANNLLQAADVYGFGPDILKAGEQLFRDLFWHIPSRSPVSIVENSYTVERIRRSARNKEIASARSLEPLFISYWKAHEWVTSNEVGRIELTQNGLLYLEKTLNSEPEWWLVIKDIASQPWAVITTLICVAAALLDLVRAIVTGNI